MPFNPTLRDEWEKAGYPRDMGSAAASLPPPAGFRRAYHLTTADHAISNIVFGRLKVARFSELNDPFELLAPIGEESHVRKLLKDHKERVNADRGLLCFSGDWTNRLLWAQYGARHKGIALGFDVEEDFGDRRSIRKRARPNSQGYQNGGPSFIQGIGPNKI